MGGRLKLINAVIDVATSGEGRPVATFFARPALSIRESYSTRITVNLVYFARNYLNIILLSVVLLSLLYPLFFLVLASAGGVHFSRNPFVSRVSKILQLCFCVYVPLTYGLGPVVLSVTVPMLIVVSHAVLTPYSNDAMECYETTMRKKGLEMPAPRSPTKEFENVDKTFADALLLPQAVSAAAAGGEHHLYGSSQSVPGGNDSGSVIASLKGFHQRTNSQALSGMGGKGDLLVARDGQSPTGFRRLASREADDAMMYTPRGAVGATGTTGRKLLVPRVAHVHRVDDDRRNAAMISSSLPTMVR